MIQISEANELKSLIMGVLEEYFQNPASGATNFLQNIIKRQFKDAKVSKFVVLVLFYNKKAIIIICLLFY